MRWRITAALILILGLAGAVAWWWWWLPRGPNVLLITLDTTRADRLGRYGYTRARTPFLDRLASEGVQFDNALTHVPLTLPSHATMLTGLLPPEHGLRTNAMGRLPQDIPTLAEHFSARGYRTGAFLGAFVLDKQFGLDRGFQKYDDDLSGDDPVDERNLARRRKANHVVDSALSWLLPHRRQPYFCWIHLYDPHDPRSEHAETFGTEFAGRGYDAELAFVDQQLERLTSRLREQSLLDNTIVVVVGDHGEALGEHGEPEHGQQLYQTTLRIPMLFHSPSRFVAGERVQTTVALNDLLPTLKDFLEWDVSIPTKVAGRSLRPALEGRMMEEVPHYCETWEPFFAMHCMPQFGLVSDGWKYIRSPQAELYEISKDPQEQANLITQQAKRGVELDVVLKDIESRFVARKSERASNDSTMDAKLGSIGYSKANATLPASDIGGRLKDVKELLLAYRLTLEALDHSAKDLPGAIATLERVGREWPDLHSARTILASLLMTRALEVRDGARARQELLARAEQICRDVIESEREWPESERSFEAHSFLAAALAATSRLDEAHKQYELATKLRSTNANLFLDWGRLCLRRNQPELALENLNRAVSLDEGLFTAQSQIGEILFERAQKLAQSNRPEDREEEQRVLTDALRHFEIATRYNSQFLPAHYFAAGILMQRKQYAAAAQHYSQIALVDKQGANIRYLWAVALANQEKNQEALRLLREALAIDPRHVQARNLLRICEEGSQ